MLDFRLPKKFVDDYRNRPVPFGWNGLGKVTFYRTYSRTDNPNVNGMESWIDVCERVINGMYSIQKEHVLYGKWNEEKALSSAMEAFDLMFNFKWTPPGRGLWMMGTPFIHERHEFAALQNCGMLSTESIRQDGGSLFSYFMEMLMLGVGMGFDTRGAGKIEIRNVFDEKLSLNGDPTYVLIHDSREGWAESIKMLVDSFLYNLPYPIFDYSAIRPKGALIKGFGGVASGPEPLRNLHSHVSAILILNQGQPITSRTITDIFNLIGTCVVAGNVRRSAEIALGSPFDEDFINLKDYKLNPQRADYGWTSNNSVIIEDGDKVDYRRLAEKTYNNGEPGYFWIDNARQYGRMNGLFEPDDSVMGANPCVTVDTVIDTYQGPKPVSDLISRPFLALVNGAVFAASGFWKTGSKNVYRLKTKEGHSIRVTDNHKILATRLTVKTQYDEWIEAKDLVEGQTIVLNNNRGWTEWDGFGTFNEGWLVGAFLGDGNFNNNTARFGFWGEHKEHMSSVALARVETLGGSQRYHKTRSGHLIEDRDSIIFSSAKVYELLGHLGVREDKSIDRSILFTSSDFQKGFLRGLFDCDGSVQGSQQKGVSIRLSSARPQHLLIAQEMLLRLGINSTIYDRAAAQYRSLPDGKGGKKEYWCKDTQELIIANDNILQYAEMIGFDKPDKRERLELLISSYSRNPNRERFVATFDYLVYEGTEDVYDCTVDTVHRFSANGLIVHNCLEQVLGHLEKCTLVEIHLPHCKTKQEFIRALKYAYLYGKTVTLLSDRINDESWDIMTQNRRIGLSTTGHTQFIGMHGIDVWKEWLDYGYHKVAGYYDKLYSQWFDIPESVRKTSVKPSGTISLVSGVTPGIHYNVADRYHIRRLTLSDDSPLLSALQRAGYRTEASVYGQGSYVVEFPIDAGPGVKSESDVSIWDQLEIIQTAQEFWADNAVSATVKFRRNEVSVDELASAIEWCSTRLKGISFLPQEDHGYAQAPYESISKEKYYAMLSEIDSAAIEDIGSSEKMMDLYCDGDACAIPQKAG